MRILHIGLFRVLSHGQSKQLIYEFESAKRMSVVWETLALVCESCGLPFERQIPRLLRGQFLRRLYFWCILLKRSREFDIVLVRHVAFDPWVLIFGWFVRNRISIHHAKEIEELKLIRKGWLGRFVSQVEKVTGFISLAQVKGILGVTQDIRDYELHRCKRRIPAHIYPNGISYDERCVIEDLRGDDINVAFVASRFSAWHGLDLLIDSAETLDIGLNKNIRVHLIGEMDEISMLRISASQHLSSIFELHGTLVHDFLLSILAKCHIGIGSLALDRQGLSEGSNLKIKDYLILGLPVYSGFPDTAIPHNYPFFKVGVADLKLIRDFAVSVSSVSKTMVSESARPFIEKSRFMESIILWLKTEVWK